MMRYQISCSFSDEKFFLFRFEKEESWVSITVHHWMLENFVHAVGPESLKLGRGCLSYKCKQLSTFGGFQRICLKIILTTCLWIVKGTVLSYVSTSPPTIEQDSVLVQNFYRWYGCNFFAPDFAPKSRWLFSSLFVFPSCTSTILRKTGANKFVIAFSFFKK